MNGNVFSRFSYCVLKTKCFASKMNIKNTQQTDTIRHHNENILIFLQTCFEFLRAGERNEIKCCLFFLAESSSGATIVFFRPLSASADIVLS